MNSLKSIAAIRWGIGVVMVMLCIFSLSVTPSQATTLSDFQFEFKSLDETQQKNKVPGDHDDVTGAKYPNVKSTSTRDSCTSQIMAVRETHSGICPQLKLAIGSIISALRYYVTR